MSLNILNNYSNYKNKNKNQNNMTDIINFDELYMNNNKTINHHPFFDNDLSKDIYYNNIFDINESKIINNIHSKTINNNYSYSLIQNINKDFYNKFFIYQPKFKNIYDSNSTLLNADINLSPNIKNDYLKMNNLKDIQNKKNINNSNLSIIKKKMGIHHKKIII